jgi:hypothetical protein
MSGDHRANYALLDFREHLGKDEDALDVPWADFVGDQSSTETFTVPTDDPVDGYVELQVYDVQAYGHEIVVNGDPLAGFDIPPHDGWQYWMDSLTGADLVAGENEIEIHRDPETLDEFVVGTVTVHWREPIE